MKLAKSASEARSIFGLYSLGIASNRATWVWDFSLSVLSDKMLLFARAFQEEMERWSTDNPGPERHVLRHLASSTLPWPDHIESALFRPFTRKYCYYAPVVTHRRYQMPRIFPHDGSGQNKIICFCVNRKQFYVLAADRVVDLHLTGDTQCLPLYRYTEDGERVSNITEWGLRQFREHYGDDDITAEDVFAYTYAALHDPIYRETYAVDLRREFPRLPFHDDFQTFARMGQKLLDLHIGFDSVEPWCLTSEDAKPSSRRKPGARLSADKERGVIVLDETTRLTGVPEVAWSYRLGNRSAIEWVLDQYKERKPRDPTIAERFNTYRFADHKERVIDLLRRVCTVSVKTMEVVDEIAARSSIR